MSNKAEPSYEPAMVNLETDDAEVCMCTTRAQAHVMNERIRMCVEN